MPTKRTPLDRQRKPVLDAETLALFMELEGVPRRQRKNREFNDRDYELHRRLGLGAERLCSQVSVFEGDDEGPGPHRIVQHADWLKVREARKQLLTAAGLGGQRQVKTS
jgi:hypothetical protein